MCKEVVKNKHGFFEIKKRPNQEELKKYYADKYYQEGRSSYELSYSKEEIKYFSNKSEQRYQIIKTISNIGVGSLLDVGCGEGFLLKYFYDMGWECTGLDFSNAGIRKNNPDQEHLLIQGDIFENLTEITNGDKQFDLIFFG